MQCSPPVAFSFEAKKRFAQNANGSSWTLGTLYYTKLAGFEEIQNGVVTTVASAALAGGLLTLLPLAHKCLSVKVIIILSVASSSFALFANGMLAWPMIKHWPGVTVWPYFCAVFQLGLALWFPLMRATAATLFGPSRFAVSLPHPLRAPLTPSRPLPRSLFRFWPTPSSLLCKCKLPLTATAVQIALGAVATAQAVNGVVGPVVWPLIYADSVDSNPPLVFYCAAGWSAIGVLVACTFPSLEEADLAAAARMLDATHTRQASGRTIYAKAGSPSLSPRSSVGSPRGYLSPGSRRSGPVVSHQEQVRQMLAEELSSSNTTAGARERAQVRASRTRAV